MIYLLNPEDVTKSIIGAVIRWIDCDTSLKPEYSGFDIVFVTIGDSKPVMRIIIVWIHFYTPFVPMNRLLVFANVVINASKSIVWMLVFRTNLNTFFIHFYRLLVITLIKVSVAQTIEASCIFRNILWKFHKFLYPIFDILCTECLNYFSNIVFFVQSQGFLCLLNGQIIVVKLKAMNIRNLLITLVPFGH